MTQGVKPTGCRPRPEIEEKKAGATERVEALTGEALEAQSPESPSARNSFQVRWGDNVERPPEPRRQTTEPPTRSMPSAPRVVPFGRARSPGSVSRRLDGDGDDLAVANMGAQTGFTGDSCDFTIWVSLIFSP